MSITILGNSCIKQPANISTEMRVEKMLRLATIFRTTGLQVTGDLYRQELLSEDKKEEIIKVANELQLSINTTATALEVYYNLEGSQGLDILEDRLKIYNAAYAQFSALIMPYLLEDIENGR